MAEAIREVPRRLLLIELVTRDPWAFNGRYFPFVAGCARAAGVEVQWLWFGVAFATEPTDSGLLVVPVLDDEGARRLVETLASWQPTHVLTSHPLGGTLARRVREHAPEAALTTAVDLGHPDGPPATEGPAQPEWPASRVAGLCDWLGLDAALFTAGGGYLVGAAPPWYGALPGNRAAVEAQPPQVVVGGVACDDLRPLAENPFFATVATGPLADWRGCAFCTTLRVPTSDPTADPVEVALAQIVEAGRSGLIGGRRSGVFHLHDVRLFRHLDRLFDGLLAAGAPAAAYELTPRVDRLLEAEDTLQALLPRLEATGNVLRIGRLGAETLVDAENQRLHKGLTQGQIDHATALLKRLLATHPKAFGWDGTFAYIAFTPWTTLADLAALLDAALERGLSEREGWLVTPLELRRGSPVLRRAEADGDLLVPTFEDPAWLYEPSQGGIDTASFVPWRFRDPRVGLAFRLVVRFAAASFTDTWPATVFAADPLYAWLVAEANRRGVPLKRPALFAREVVRGLAESPEASASRNVEGLTPEGVATAALDRVAALPAPAEGPTPSETESQPGLTPAPRARRLLQAAIATLPSLRAIRLAEVGTSGVRGHLRVALTLGPLDVNLELEPRVLAKPCCFRVGPFDVSHGRDTPVRNPDDLKTLRRLVEAYVRLAGRSAPELLPPDERAEVAP